MSTKLRGLLVLFGMLLGGILFAQEKTVTGTVTDSNGFPLADVNVSSSSGQEVFTDTDGNYSIQANANDVLTFESLGLEVATAVVGEANAYNVTLREGGTIELEGAVVTALGITRDKKSLGYATQEVSGEELSNTPVNNFADALAGQVAGAKIQSYGNFGGSANMIVRGYGSITGSNQALVVIDGTPILNNVTNTLDQTTGRGGYDYGNSAMDINPEDIASINILKGSAATALYGSRAGNGAIIITTKKGSNKKSIGVEIKSSVMVGAADKETLPKYQNKYGAGYGPFYGANEDSYFNDQFDINGDGINDLSVPFTEDASYGAAFDPNLMVYQWNSLYPQLSTYQTPTPWVAAKHTPNDMFGISTTYLNSAAFGGSTDVSDFRLSYTNFDQTGNLPNSKIKRNTVTFSGGYKFTDDLEVRGNVTYVNTKGKGRYGTGYDGLNVMQAFRQWFETNVDIYEQRDTYFQTGLNTTWNASSWDDTTPIYTDNAYWTRYENYETDERNRYFGNVSLNYELTDWLSVMGRITFDTYSQIQEERINKGSNPVAKYSIYNLNSSEYNYDLIFSINKDITEDLNFDSNVGWNLFVQKNKSDFVETNGGLKLPRLYTLDNTANPISEDQMIQTDTQLKIDGVYARAGFGYKNALFLEGSVRTDHNSSLPSQNMRYWYPAAMVSFVFSELIDADWLNFGKVRGNYAQVGQGTQPYRTRNLYGLVAGFNGNPLATLQTTYYDPDIKAEISEEWEAGLEMSFLKNRIGFDVSYYHKTTDDLLTFVPLSTSTGYSQLFTNGGSILNEGFEVMLNLVPLRSDNFRWDINVNWAKNESEVLSLKEGIDYLEMAGVQGGISLGASVGDPFGVIKGSDFVYDENGNKVVGANGRYLISETNNNVIGDINPDWTGSVRNSLSYKNWSLGFLIDVQQGGDVFSLDTWYGYATGLYDFSAGTNDLGNPIRNSIADGGGIILPGVKEDGTPNDIRVDASNYANPYGYVRSPNKAHVYDASFVKLREASVSYNLPKKLLRSTPIQDFTISLIGRNLWIIHKNVPYSDPEAGLSAGNIQGYQSGAYPTIREIGASIKLNF